MVLLSLKLGSFYILWEGEEDMLNELIKAFLFIFMAEMGDKTQILAMTFATQYSVRKVLTGVFIGSFLNHGLAVLLGFYLSTVININAIQLIAAIAFIGFGLWTLKSGDKNDEEEGKQRAFGPVLTVAMAFFIGELGDKTQLTAVTLATDANYPLFILMGTVLGMIVTSAIGIFVGSKLGKKIPEHAIKFGAASIFLFFGILKLFENVPKNLLIPVNIIIFFVLIGGAVYFLVKPSICDIRSKRMTPLKEVAEEIHIKKMKSAVDKICLGSNDCRRCGDEECLIRYLKDAVETAGEDARFILPKKLSELPSHRRENKNFDYEKVREGLVAAVHASLECSKKNKGECLANKSREALEIIYFGETIPFSGNLEDYIKGLKQRDQNLAKEIAISLLETDSDK
jgi:Ca2+/H+ antiporter, TMEM165/GDT1 family